MLRGNEQLEAVLAGVAGARDVAVHAGDGALDEAEVRELPGVAGVLRQQLLGTGALEGEEAHLAGPVFHRHAGWKVSSQPGHILFAIRRVDHDHEIGRRALVDDQVVDDATVLATHQVVLRVPCLHARHIVGHDAVEESLRIAALDVEPAHVRHVE